MGKPESGVHYHGHGLQVQLFREWEEEQEPPRKRMTVFALTANVSGTYCYFLRIYSLHKVYTDFPSDLQCL